LYKGHRESSQAGPLILKVVNRKDLQKRGYIANPSSEEGV